MASMLGSVIAGPKGSVNSATSTANDDVLLVLVRVLVLVWEVVVGEEEEEEEEEGEEEGVCGFTAERKEVSV